MSDWLDFKSIKREVNLESVLRYTAWTCGAAVRTSTVDAARFTAGRAAMPCTQIWLAICFTALHAVRAARCWTSSRPWSAVLCTRQPKN